jgi:hypothetical protein
MATTHAWFSAETALRIGSAVYRKPDNSTVNVTRMNEDKGVKGHFPTDENYVGEVIREEDGGCARQTSRVAGISD